MKIGILAHDFISWGGGVDFLRTVMDSLLMTPGEPGEELHLLIPDSGPRLAWRKTRRKLKEAVRSLKSGKPPPPTTLPSSEIIAHAFSEFRGRIIIQHIDIGRFALARTVKRLGLAVVLPALHPLRADFPRPWVGYAYDFQHKYFPENFPPEDLRSRDRHFVEMLTRPQAVIVNSRAAAADIAKFVPERTARVFALPFAPAPNADWFEDRPEILTRYGVTRPYFIIANQFWVHKDHATGFAAFGMVAAQRPEIGLVCTGSPHGSRDPEHFLRLMKQLKDSRLEDRVRILGLIPKRDQIELLKHACAVVQPTLFEGGPGGGSVYDAVSLGVPAIISDLPVNREIDGGEVTFFPARNAAALAGQMLRRLDVPARKQDPAELIAEGQRRRAACGRVLREAIASVM